MWVLEKNLKIFDVFANAGYDYREKYFKTWQVGVDMQIRCFSFGGKNMLAKFIRC